MMTKDERQAISLKKIVASNCHGTVEAVTAFGKTKIGTDVITYMRRTDNRREVIVVVPTVPLKDQWEEELQKLQLSDNSEVVVINTLIDRQPFKTDLLLLDEIHRMAAPTFAKVFNVVRYDFILGLTATLKRLDGRHEILQKHAPIVDVISMAEAKRNGWIASYVEYNLAVPMTPEDRELYRQMTTEYGFYSGKFQNDFELMKNCSFSVKPFWKRTETGAMLGPFEPTVVRYARRLGWTGNTVRTAYDQMIDNKRKARGQAKPDIWGNTNHPYSPAKLYVYGVNGMRTIRKMKAFIQDYPAKIDMTAQIIRSFDRKAITFGETIASVERLTAMLGDIAVAYHSEVRSAEVKVKKVKGYKTMKAADNWSMKHPEWKWDSKHDDRYWLSAMVTKKVPAKEVKRQILRRVLEDPLVRVVCTARALDQGANFPNVSLGVTHGRTSSPTQHIQRSGRILRLHTFTDGTEKQAILVNIYLEDTKDYRWLVKAQKKSAGVLWVSSIEEILEDQQTYVQ